MRKKTILTAIMSLSLAFGISAMSACEGITVTPDGNGGVVVKPINPGNITVAPDGNGGVTITPGTTSSDSNSENNADIGTSQTPEIPETSETPSGGDSAEKEEPETPVIPDDPTPETPVVPEPQKDYGDLSASEYITTKTIDKWLVHSQLTVQAEETSTLSKAALKGTFSAKGANETYDSSQDPNGDGGRWVWTALTLDFKSIYNDGADLDGYTFSFDVKVDNADTTSSILLYNSAHQRSTQIPFNNSSTTTHVCGAEFSGFRKTILPGGWANISIDLDAAFGSYEKTSIEELYIIFSNAFGDYTKDVVFYVDNMYFKNADRRIVTPTNASVDKGDYADPNIMESKQINRYVAYSDLVLQDEVVSADSTSAIKGTFSNKGVEAYTETGKNEIWSTVCFDLEALYGGLANMQNKTIGFDVKVDNCNRNVAMTVMNKDEQLLTEYSFNCLVTSTYDDPHPGFNKYHASNGWVRVYVDLENFFPSDVLANVKYFILIFSNVDSNEDKPSTYYIDNVTIDNTVPKYEEPNDPDIWEDIATMEYASSKIINNYVVHADIVEQAEVSSSSSDTAIKGSFRYNTQDAYTENGKNEVWSVLCFDLEAYFGETQNATSAHLTFDILLENCNESVAISIMGEDGIRQQEYSLNCNPNKPDSGAVIRTTKTVLLNGWIRFTIFLEPGLFEYDASTNAKYLFFIFSNVGCDEEQDSTYYIDNVYFISFA